MGKAADYPLGIGKQLRDEMICDPVAKLRQAIWFRFWSRWLGAKDAIKKCHDF